MWMIFLVLVMVYSRKILWMKSARDYISNREENRFRYTGVDVEKVDVGIVMNQKMFHEKMEEISVDKDEDSEKPLYKTEFKSFRKEIGQIYWIADQTRPDLSFNSLEMSYHNKDARINDIQKINKVIRKVKAGDSVVKFSQLGNIENLKVLAVSDAALYKTEEKTKGVAGRFIFLSNQ